MNRGLREVAVKLMKGAAIFFAALYLMDAYYSQGMYFHALRDVVVRLLPPL